MTPSDERPPSESRVERAFAGGVLVLMALVTLVEMVARRMGGGVAGSFTLVQHLTLVITFSGAVLAAGSDRLLALSTANVLPERFRGKTRIITSGLGAGLAWCLASASWDLVVVEHDAAEIAAWGVPVWIFLAVMPIGYVLIASRLIWRASDSRLGRAAACWGLVLPVLFAFWSGIEDIDILFPGAMLLLAGTIFGTPIFATIGGAALMLYWYDGTPVAAAPSETYRLTASPMLPAIPLFTLGGYILTEGGASQRLLRLFRALVGWLPGGLAIVTTLVLAFFTPLTGASGVTILSMGGLLAPVLVKAHYPERTSLGLVTVSGSIGLLFPPSLPVILYAFYANLSIEDLFVAGLVPGAILVVAVALWAAWRGWHSGARPTPFNRAEAKSALWGAKWEVLLPVVVLGGIFSGYATLVEAAAATVLYAFVLECGVHRDLDIRKDLPRILVECATLVGGFMIILGVALGFTSFLVFDDVPTRALDWVQMHITSPWVFLLALNLFLIVVGALMDIYSAIIVVTPLIIPIAAAYQIDPVHMGIIFLANMELGYLMPPMGENLFLAAYRFDKSLAEVYRSTLPYVAILLAAVLLITYWPTASLGLVEILRR